MNVLVTGGAGYLGSVLCEHLLNAGHGVTVLDTLMYGQPTLLHLCGRSGFSLVCGDARDATLLAHLLGAVNAVVPLAAVVGAPACARRPEDATSTNVGAIRSLLDVSTSRQLIVFPNTNSGYGSQPGICTEDTPLRPLSHYAKTKADAETAVLASGHGISLRLATAFGASPRMRLDLMVNDFVWRSVTDGALMLFEPGARRNFVHVRDIADAIVFCLGHPALAGRAYNVGLDAANMTKGELADRIARQVPGCVVHPVFGPRDPDQRDYVVSTERLRLAGWEARRSLDDGIRELLVAYRMLTGPSAWRNA